MVSEEGCEGLWPANLGEPPFNHCVGETLLPPRPVLAVSPALQETLVQLWGPHLLEHRHAGTCWWSARACPSKSASVPWGVTPMT